MPILTILKLFWKEIAGVLIIALLLYQAYSTVYGYGYEDAAGEWEAKFAQIEKERDEKIAQIEGFSRTTLEQSLINDSKTKKDLALILSNMKGAPATSVPDCIPTSQYINSYNQMIDVVNK
jgi:hypothetical protein